MLQKMHGIVLHSLKYNDTSLIVDLYTDVNGRMSFIVPLPRSRRSAVKSSLFQPLALVELEADVKARGGLTRIREVKSYSPFNTIPYDPAKSAIALFIAEFLYRALREEDSNNDLFSFLLYSITWLDECGSRFANFHLVFLMRLSRFLGFYPNLESYTDGDVFDLQAAVFVSEVPTVHSFYINPDETRVLRQLMRLSYDTMSLFAMSRSQRARCLTIVLDYYRLHLPEFSTLKSVDVLRELFD